MHTMDKPLKVPGERQVPLYFAGRRDELAELDEKLRDLCATGDPTNGLQLTVGVPGAGKTQLAGEFASRIGGETVRGRTVAVLNLPPEDLNSPADLFVEMSSALNEVHRGKRIAGHDDRVSGVTIGAMGLRTAWATDVASARPAGRVRVCSANSVPAAKLDSFVQVCASQEARHTPSLDQMLRRSEVAGMWDGKALVLMVDELQGVDDRGMESLRVLHQGLHQCPILLLGFGLRHTATRLADRRSEKSISRTAPPTILGPLNDDDTRDAFATTLSMLEHNEVPNESIEALAQASFGFPQHVNGYLAGAHEALLRHGHLTGSALDEALSDGCKRRQDYYEDRLEKITDRRAVLAVAAAMETAGSATIPVHEAADAVIAAGFSAEDMDSAVAHGALTLYRGEVSFGIPSFHDYMRNLLANERQRTDSRPATAH